MNDEGLKNDEPSVAPNDVLTDLNEKLLRIGVTAATVRSEDSRARSLCPESGITLKSGSRL
ncbi:hypothetical protein EJ05DRAFT_481315 [Pseudovirgaria hyperparasitica]|uniref:Uncharacterized protein n=1 Tax=Pseudovirgaria hyperparasitica TaxID=470096 RepID=A0A6A6VQC7_9PEZI|nr:uncharacterized protein EJ05DRAFT_481318 [Pseudovirgaria hyperparasitica]XP_033594861.1 uncharacterized protein EJ05DRAFT_481315 [Pseudovirgaria hyperparasitica]KAF2752400.1 hypothetical protein EJ05DRAFT_481318 [Pseudovirgaria hyperparasitica]KAF2752403.1 hypothetical protein EJ05DRAFT_481315 [Pseudovirgaria hyperparasitica]